MTLKPLYARLFDMIGAIVRLLVDFFGYAALKRKWKERRAISFIRQKARIVAGNRRRLIDSVDELRETDKPGEATTIRHTSDR